MNNVKIEVEAFILQETARAVRQELESIRKGIEHDARESNGYWYQLAEWRDRDTFVFETFSTKGRYVFEFHPERTLPDAPEWSSFVARFEGYRNSFIAGSMWGIHIQTKSVFPECTSSMSPCVARESSATIKIGDVEIDNAKIRVFETSMPEKPLCRYCDFKVDGKYVTLEEAERVIAWLKEHPPEY